MANLAQIDQLIQAGLLPIKYLAYGRIILSDVYTGVTNMVYRNFAIKMYSQIINLCLTDQILYQRLRQLLLQSHPTQSAAFESLANSDDLLENHNTLHTIQRSIKQ